MKEQPKIVRDVIVIPIARLSPYGLVYAFLSIAFSYILGIEKGILYTFTTFIFTLSLPLFIALVFSSLIILLDRLIHSEQKLWRPLVAFSCPIVIGLSILYSILSELLAFLPEIFVPLLIVFTPLFCICGVVEYSG